MKRLLVAMILALGLPVAVAAQDSPPPGPPMMHHGMSDADRAKMMQMHNQMRTAALSALTPAHKTLLANVVGGLAVAADPDPKAAAAKLDAALSPAEKQGILAAANAMQSQMHAMMSPPPGASPHPERGMHMTDPGEILLMMSAMSAMNHSDMMMMHDQPH